MDYFDTQFTNVAVSDQKGSLERIEKILVEGYIFNAEITSQNLDCEFVVLNAVYKLTKFLNHYLFDDRFYHGIARVISNIYKIQLWAYYVLYYL